MKSTHKSTIVRSIHQTVQRNIRRNGTGLLSPLFLLSVFLFLNSSTIQAQVTLTASSGTSTGTFTNLKGAFDAINAGTHQGAISIQINSSTTETASAVLNASGSGSASYTSINIYPTATALSISGSLAAPLIDLSGADSVTIDGRVNATGSTKSLTITNTNTSSTAGTSTIRFINDATQNTVKYCTLSGATTQTTGGIVLFSTTTLTTGNDNNTIDNNNITNSGSRSLNGIYALGTTGKENSGVIIQNNNIFDIFPSGTTAGNCVSINGGNTGFTISGNSFYETTSWNPGNTGFNVIQINNTSGNNFDVSNNYIGGRAPSCGGSAWTKGTGGRCGLNCINMNVGSITASSIQGNTITNWNYSNSSNTRDWTGIYIAAGSVNIGTVQGNIIGAATGTGAVTGNNCSTLYGIYSISNNSLVIRNNIIGSLTNTTPSNLRGIDASGSGTLTIENNTIGSTSTANSINASSTSNSGVIGINVAGTGTISISGNTIANMSSNATSATNLTGIACSSGSNLATISGNFLHSISYTNTSSIGNLTGISLTAGTNSIYNNIISIGNNNPALTYGIASTGGTNKIYFNTVYLSGTPTSGAYNSAALNSAETSVRDIRNNIFFNGRSNGGATGSHYAVVFGSSVTGNLDYNNYYVSGTGGVLGNNNGSNSTSLPLVTSQDANSIITNPGFISTGTTASGYEPVVAGRGVAITGVTVDYNGSSRGSTVTMGALIACLNPSSGGTIAASQISYNTFDPVAFTSSAAPSGFIGTLEYKWQSSTTSSSSGFSDIVSSNVATYDPGVVTQTTWFKRLARSGCTSNWSGAAESNVVEATICIPATNIINTPSATELTCIIPSISLTATGGVSYSWSNGSTIVGSSASLSVSSPATYTVTVTAANGCTSTAAQVITQNITPPTAVITPPTATELTCSNTSISLTATGGGTYSWSNGSTTVGSSGSLTVTSPATYSVTVTAVNGCTSTATQGITQNITPPTAVITPPTATELTCSNTSISLTATGGGTYSWSNGSTTVGSSGSLSVISPATYSVTVTAANGCTSTATQGITQNITPPTAVITPPTATELTCSNTSISLTATGGGTYSWSNGSTTVGSGASLSVTSPGTYRVTVTAANGCTSTATQGILQDITAPTAVINTPTNTELTCSNTSILLTATGGGSYSWSNGSTTVGSSESLSVTSSATYSVTVTATNGCTSTATQVITQNITPPTAVITAPTATELTCSNTSISLTATGGGTYSWSNGSTTVGSSGSLSVTSPATYSVTVTAANGCTSTAAQIITQNITPPTAVINMPTATELTCSNTSISLTATGGGTYSWSNGSTTVGSGASLSVTSPGTYRVTVTAANGCTSTATQAITQNIPLITVTAIPNGNIVCWGGTTSVTVSATGGTGSYVSSSIGLINNVYGGSNTFTVTDTQGCTGSTTILIPQPPAISITGSSQAGCFSNSSSFSVQVSNGKPPYTTNTAYDVSGNLIYSVTDADGCMQSATINR